MINRKILTSVTGLLWLNETSFYQSKNNFNSDFCKTKLTNMSLVSARLFTYGCLNNDAEYQPWLVAVVVTQEISTNPSSVHKLCCLCQRRKVNILTSRWWGGGGGLAKMRHGTTPPSCPRFNSSEYWLNGKISNLKTTFLWNPAILGKLFRCQRPRGN